MAEEEKLYGNVLIGEVFKYNHKIYTPTVTENRCKCRECDLFKECVDNIDKGYVIFACDKYRRDDKTSCVFKLVKNE